MLHILLLWQSFNFYITAMDIVERKLHLYLEAFEFHQRQRPKQKPTYGKHNSWAFVHKLVQSPPF